MKAKILLATIALLSSTSAQDLLQHSLEQEDETDNSIELVTKTDKAAKDTSVSAADDRSTTADDDTDSDDETAE